MTSHPPRRLIVGYGNTLRSDDGAGPRVIDRLALHTLPAGVELTALVQLEIDLAERLSQCEEVVFVDASREGTAGEIRSGEVPAASDAGDLTHHVTPHALLEVAARFYDARPRATFVSITGRNFDVGETLSPEVEQAVEAVVEQLITLPPS